MSMSVFQDPYTELFIWAILTNKPMLVDFFWQRTDQPLLNALIAASIYSKLSNWYRVHLKYDEHEKVLPALKLKFQTRAQQVFSHGICCFISETYMCVFQLFINLKTLGCPFVFQLIDIAFRTDPVKVTSLLERRNPRWGDRNLMEISYIGYLRAFIASN